ncbi:hypothetical protein BAE44_0021067 [Dichanthelium oligosanthes]|uniref:Uncharacterized protein n=1 Tax=Dichanthelium oligosanthes TaxID=888268 RepID=A0A1E5UYF4_9POAL|nr:hypothetical protein BAE44_0021067 [Dichanthelium oligosanthes]
MASSSSSASSPHRKLLHSLVYWAVQRCRMSESPCRLTVSLKRPAEPASTSPLRVSVSDTGVGSKLEEFLELDALARETPIEKWDGTLLITTTGMFSVSIGTEVCLCLSNEADADDFILWLVGFFHKILVLRAAVSISELLSFLELDLLKIGTGAANNVDGRKAKGLHVEVVIVTARTASDFSCWKVNCSSTQVREYVPDLAESIAGLILSSNDKEFQDECIALLGLGSDQDISEGLVQSSISEKMVRIIELNDTKENVDTAPYLFECERLDEDSQLDEGDADEDMVFDF